ncbi:uncharacterized protein [Cherax quadricarinatus]|uniref:uncharacterized protein isoform X2 n=1 Tax=Cherax quadricarinatus TaxID=27406 RepID=UPI00387E2286
MKNLYRKSFVLVFLTLTHHYTSVLAVALERAKIQVALEKICDMVLEGPGSRDGFVDFSSPQQEMCLSMNISNNLSRNYTIKCFYGSHAKPVYNCSSTTTCHGEGILKSNTYPSNYYPCTGLPLTNINSDHLGNYTCHLNAFGQSCTATYSLQNHPGSDHAVDPERKSPISSHQPSSSQSTLVCLLGVMIAWQIQDMVIKRSKHNSQTPLACSREEELTGHV